MENTMENTEALLIFENRLKEFSEKIYKITHEKEPFYFVEVEGKIYKIKLSNYPGYVFRIALEEYFYDQGVIAYLPEKNNIEEFFDRYLK